MSNGRINRRKKKGKKRGHQVRKANIRCERGEFKRNRVKGWEVGRLCVKGKRGTKKGGREGNQANLERGKRKLRMTKK